jgi:hypothetical protein
MKQMILDILKALSIDNYIITAVPPRSCSSYAKSLICAE